MKIKVTKCGDCIFRNHDWNPDAMGFDTHDSCTLLQHLAIENSHIATYDLTNDKGEENHPKSLETVLKNCPLKQGDISVNLATK